LPQSLCSSDHLKPAAIDLASIISKLFIKDVVGVSVMGLPTKVMIWTKKRLQATKFKNVL
jgi:hypothetical protein